jgi:hypothetical protein
VKGKKKGVGEATFRACLECEGQGTAGEHLELVGQPRELRVQPGGPFAGGWVGTQSMSVSKIRFLYFENCGLGLSF